MFSTQLRHKQLTVQQNLAIQFRQISSLEGGLNQAFQRAASGILGESLAVGDSNSTPTSRQANMHNTEVAYSKLQAKLQVLKVENLFILFYLFLSFTLCSLSLSAPYLLSDILSPSISHLTRFLSCFTALVDCLCLIASTNKLL